MFSAHKCLDQEKSNLDLLQMLVQDPEFKIRCPLEFLPPEVHELILNAERSIDS